MFRLIYKLAAMILWSTCLARQASSSQTPDSETPHERISLGKFNFRPSEINNHELTHQNMTTPIL